jgi:hypothetical protein
VELVQGRLEFNSIRRLSFPLRVAALQHAMRGRWRHAWNCRCHPTVETSV